MSSMNTHIPRILIILCWLSYGYSETNVTLGFDPVEIEEIFEGDVAIVFFNITPCCPVDTALTLKVDDDLVAEITENRTVILPSGVDVFNGSFGVKGKRLGLALISFMFHDAQLDLDEDDNAQTIYEDYRVVVLRDRQLRDEIYRYGIIVFASIIYFGFGCQIDLNIIFGILKKPVAPLIGIFCQFVVMPLLGFGVAKLIGLDDAFAFGLLAMSTSPGGGGSNSWAYLLQGDLNLSITMTFCSTTLSLVFMPFWMWALGRFFISERVDIPYVSLVRTLLTLVICLFIGVMIRKFTEKTANFLIKITKPITLLFIAFLLIYGTWVNWYMYEIMATVPEVIPAAILLPWFGFFIGWLIAYVIARLGKRKSVTVGLETGYQNPSIPIIMLQGNFVQPEGDLGAVMPIATALFTQIPLIVYYGYLEIAQRVCKKVDVEDTEEGNAKDIESNSKENNGYLDSVDNVEVKEKQVEDKIENGACTTEL